jgi:hypothetical protein
MRAKWRMNTSVGDYPASSHPALRGDRGHKERVDILGTDAEDRI